MNSMFMPGAFTTSRFQYNFINLIIICYICDRLRENRAQRGVRKYREKIDRFLKNVLFEADGRERLGLL